MRALINTTEREGGLAEVRAAAIDTFERRAKHAWPPTPVITETWRDDYPKIAAEVAGAPATVEEAAAYVVELIARVDGA